MTLIWDNEEPYDNNFGYKIPSCDAFNFEIDLTAEVSNWFYFVLLMTLTSRE